MEQNWQSVADALRASRLAKGLSQEELAIQASTSRSSIQLLEGGQPRKRISRTMREVAAVLGWPDGHIEQLLAGAATGPPAKPPVTPQQPQPQGDLPFAVMHELGLGDLIDAQVVDLGISDARMIVVVRAAEGASREQVEEALEEWRRLQTKLAEGDQPTG